MPENSGSTTTVSLLTYIDRATNAHTSILEHQREIAQVRQDARTDKFDMEAVNLLGLIIAKSPHDNGVGLLTDIFKYAHQTGIKLTLSAADHREPAPVLSQNERDNKPDVPYFRPTKVFLDKRFCLIVQLALGLVVSGSFIWLLR